MLLPLLLLFIEQIYYFEPCIACLVNIGNIDQTANIASNFTTHSKYNKF